MTTKSTSFEEWLEVQKNELEKQKAFHAPTAGTVGADYKPPQKYEETSLYFKPDPAIAVVTNNRHYKRNSSTPAEGRHHGELFMKAIEDPEVKVIVFNSFGSDFATGDDLNQPPAEAAGLRPGERMGQAERLGQFFGGMGGGMGPMNSLKNTIASVQGWCLGGGGFDLVQETDLCIACECAKFAQPEERIGMAAMVYPQSFLHFGWKRTRELYLHGGALSAQKAMDWGLVNEVVPHDDQHKTLWQETMRWARGVANHPADGLMNGRVCWVNMLKIFGADTALQAKSLHHVLFTTLTWRGAERELNYLRLRKHLGPTEAFKYRNSRWAELGFYLTGVGEGYGYEPKNPTDIRNKEFTKTERFAEIKKQLGGR